MNIIYMPGWRDEDLEMVRNLASAGTFGIMKLSGKLFVSKQEFPTVKTHEKNPDS